MDATQLPPSWERLRDPSRPWMFLVSSPSRLGDLPNKLGLADYSYGFVVKSLVPVLERLGQWRQVTAPESRLIHVAAQAIEEGFRPVHLAVMPVQSAYLTPAVPTILFPFWEFPRIPDQDFGWETRHNWARVARRASMIVTACEMTAGSFRRAGVTCPVEVVPVPVAERNFGVPSWSPEFTWRIDCRHITLGGPAAATGNEAAPTTADCPRPHGGMKGHYRRYIQPLLPARAQRQIWRVRRAIARKLRRPAPPATAPDMRRVPAAPLELSGLVYTTIFNLADLRKNPKDLMTAFLLAFKDRPDATLVLKLATTPDLEFHHVEHLRHMHRGFDIEHQCRLVIIADYLSDDDLQNLFRATTYYVNTSRAEGACLPLQQALASGRPAIAPVHTSMADYMDHRVGFTLAMQPEPTHWPHDPEKRIRTSWNRLAWPTLHEQYLRSAELVDERRGEYEAMAAAARQRMQDYGSVNRVTEAFRRAIDRLGEVALGASGWDEDLAA